MKEFSGKRNGYKRPPPNYKDHIILETTTYGNKRLASGQWTAKGFVLRAESLVRIKNTLKSNPGVLEIRDSLLREGALVKANDVEYYKLLQDVLLKIAPSSVARLVHGNDRNGDEHWKAIDTGRTLGQLKND